MSDLGPFACAGCGAPLRFCGLTAGIMFQCLRARPGRHHCDPANPREEPIKRRPRNVEVFACSAKCGWEVKIRPGDPRPETRDCQCGGFLIFNRVQSR